MSKLNESSAVAIAASADTDKELASRFGVSQSTIKMVKRGITWSHVTGIKTKLSYILRKSSTVVFLDAIRIIGPSTLEDVASALPCSRNTAKNTATDLVRFGVLRRDDENRLHICDDFQANKSGDALNGKLTPKPFKLTPSPSAGEF